MELKENCEISYLQRWNCEANDEKKAIDQTSQMDPRLWWELAGLWATEGLKFPSSGLQGEKRLGLKGKKLVFYRDIII